MEEALISRTFVASPEMDGCDAHLAEAARQDPAAFAELYERYHARIYRYIYHRVGSQADAEDITAHVFMKALEGLPAYQSRHGSVAPWLFRITHNCVVDHYRKRRVQQTLDDYEYEAADADPLSHALGSERREEFAALMGHLSVEQREVVTMRYASDLSFGEIAAVMNKKEPAIRMLLHRGLRRLKAVMDDEHVSR